MATITLKINERSKAGKALKNLIDVLVHQPGVEVVQDKEKSTYNPDFVKKIKASYDNEKRTRIDTADIWESI